MKVNGAIRHKMKIDLIKGRSTLTEKSSQEIVEFKLITQLRSRKLNQRIFQLMFFCTEKLQGFLKKFSCQKKIIFFCN